MNYGELMSALKNKPAEHIYLLAGEESYYIDRAEKKIFEKLFPSGYSADDIQVVDSSIPAGDLVGIVSTVPFFLDKNVIVVRGTSLLSSGRKGAEAQEEDTGATKKASAKEAQLLQLLEDIPEFSYLIFEHHGKADKRKRLYKAIAKYGQVMESELVRAYNIGDWLQGKLQEMHKSMDGEAYAYFTGAVSMMQPVSLGYLSQELDKLDLFMGSEERLITRQMLDSVLSDMPELNGFAMTDAIGEKNLKKALLIFRKQVNNGVYIAKIHGSLVFFVRQQLQLKHYIKAGISGTRLLQQAGFKNKYALDHAVRKNRGFDEAVLEDAFVQLADIDYGIKNGFAGAADLETLIVKLCTGK